MSEPAAFRGVLLHIPLEAIRRDHRVPIEPL